VGGVRRRLDKVQEKSGYQRTTLVCLECGEEFTAYGDVALEYIVYEYSQGTQAESYRSGATPEDILRIFDHEHDPSAFVEKTSGLPFLSKALSGFNLSEPPRGIEDEI
jgi:hypothetical protein